ncbi:MAG TPA: hypothetical protein DEB17_02525 [Chlorobaculum sp.]|uniref:Uncharacterized protein n=1 Tax=Chlorobaculum tepidum (strain ATCC 49652 / DSM 12025 / NBRC 103806 / TLS) TaxID=194439 RepID=Q8KEH4_CHLTE|nr:hypothetical protein CT0715 [Chlorobaculum tepidum TLS]HBU22872.1 hypothetical protein [Chlorobaculum sp.]
MTMSSGCFSPVSLEFCQGFVQELSGKRCRTGAGTVNWLIMYDFHRIINGSVKIFEVHLRLFSWYLTLKQT